MKTSRFARLAVLVIVCVAVSSFVGYLFATRGLLNTYYRVKYFSVATQTTSNLAARKICRANPFFNQQYAVLIDMGRASNQPRLQVVDLQRLQPVLREQVMHGKHSGTLYATHFSNRIGSQKTALGRYVVVKKYNGKFGQAYRLVGLDKSNSNALSRSIVLHSSKWIGAGKVGRSQGCPAVSVAALAAMRPYVEEGTLVWIYK